MDTVYTYLTGQPILLALFVVVAAFIVYFILKKLLKLALILAIIAAAFLLYIYFSAENPEEQIQQILDTGKEKIEQVQKGAGELREQIEDKIDKPDVE